MIPCLYDKTETLFNNNGIGKLCDATECIVTEKRNNSYELRMVYPITGLHATDLIEENIIVAKPSENNNSQAFRIYKVYSSLENGEIEVNARHISYQQSHITVSPFSASTASEAISKVKTKAVGTCPFTFSTDIEKTALFTISTPVTIRNCLGDEQNSILKTYGGEYEWDMYNTILHAHRGNDNGVRIVYGKNLIDVEMEKSIENMATGVHPFWHKKDSKTGEETLVELPEKIITLNHNQAYEKIEPLDCSSIYTDEPTYEDLREYAEWYLGDEKFSRPDADIKVEFIQLWQHPGYEDIAEAEQVSLCDIVHVYINRLNAELIYKVTETEYNVLTERYNSIVLSNAVLRPTNKRHDFITRISDISDRLETAESALSKTATEQKQIASEIRIELSNAESTIYSSIEITNSILRTEFNNAISDVHSSITQTASMIRAEVHASDSRLSASITITASSIRSEVNNAISDMHSSIIQTASMIRSEVHAADSKLSASITITASSIRSEVHNGISDLHSQILQTASMIRSEVYASDSRLSASITITASSIRSEVNNAISGLRSSITQTASQIRAEVHAADSKISASITITASSIKSEVTNAISGVKSQIKQTADKIALVVDSNNNIKAAQIVASINDAGSNVLISADHIVLDGEAVADSLSGEGIIAESINVDSIDAYAIYGYQWYITDADGTYLNKKVTDAISSIQKDLTLSAGQIGIKYTRLDGRVGYVNFNIADTQYYIDGVSAARNSARIISANDNIVSGTLSLSAGSSMTLYPGYFVGNSATKISDYALTITAGQSTSRLYIWDYNNEEWVALADDFDYTIDAGSWQTMVVMVGANDEVIRGIIRANDNEGLQPVTPTIQNVYRKQNTNSIGIVYSDGSKLQRTASELPAGAWTNMGFS